MKFSTAFFLGLAAIAFANPIPEAEAEASDVSDLESALPHPLTATDKRDVKDDITAALPHPLEASDIMVSDEEPADLVTRQNANITTSDAKGKGKGKAKGNGKGKGKAAGNGNGTGKGNGKAAGKATAKAKKVSCKSV